MKACPKLLPGSGEWCTGLESCLKQTSGKASMQANRDTGVNWSIILNCRWSGWCWSDFAQRVPGVPVRINVVSPMCQMRDSNWHQDETRMCTCKHMNATPSAKNSPAESSKGNAESNRRGRRHFYLHTAEKFYMSGKKKAVSTTCPKT